MHGAFEAKNIVLGVTGSISAYKACDIASKLVHAGASVTAVLTESARQLVSPAAFEAVTGNPCITGLFDPVASREIEHITLARRADLFLIAPATANIIAKTAHGLADDWLSTALLATEAPVLFAPAMNMRMYGHPATQANFEILRRRTEGVTTGAGRYYFAGPGEGELACGDVGPGRLLDTDFILEAADAAMCMPKDLQDLRILLSSGPNHEPIDPVRFIGNHSSGKMGYALAREALRRGATLTIVSGPADVKPPFAADVINVSTGQEMFDAVDNRINDADVFISAAAVSDYRCAQTADTKIKRNDGGLTLELVPNPDIVAHAGARKRKDQLIIGFAAESTNLVENAQAKLRSKQLDMIVANPVGGAQSTIAADSVRATFLFADGSSKEHPEMSKAAFATELFDAIVALRQGA